MNVIESRCVCACMYESMFECERAIASVHVCANVHVYSCVYRFVNVYV